jgi:hypothetical protein
MELEPLVPSSLGNAAIWFRGIVVFNEDRHINFNASHDEAMRLVEGLLSNCPMMKLVGNERLIKFLKKIVDMAERGKSGQ